MPDHVPQAPNDPEGLQSLPTATVTSARCFRRRNIGCKVRLHSRDASARRWYFFPEKANLLHQKD
jgi:hypothetical protein